MQWHDDVGNTFQINSQHILFEGLFGHEWYLGQWVVWQSLGFPHFMISHPLPDSMRCASDLASAAFKEAMKGFDATTLLLDGDYAEFVHTSLRIPFDVGVPRVHPQ